MVLGVTQQAFDDAVKENMEEFEMSAEDAIKETVEQFTAQGADLSKIVTDWMMTKSFTCPALSEAIQALGNLNKETGQTDPDQFIAQLQVIKKECGKDLKFQVLAGKEGAYNVILETLAKCQSNKALVKHCLKSLVVLMTKQPDLLDDSGIQAIITYLDREDDLEIIKLLLQWTKECCTLHEKNRQNIFDAGILAHMKPLLSQANADILKDVLAVLRALVLDDDVRVEFGKSHEHARVIASDTVCTISALFDKFKKDESVMNDIMLTLSALLVRTEFCKTLEDAGGLKIIHEAMIEFLDKDKIIKQCLKLLKTLAGNDECKAHIIQNGMAPIIVASLDQHKGNVNTAVFGLGCIAVLSLRNPDNSKVLFEAGITDVIVEIMKLHSDNENVQKNASWAIRNMVSRSRYQNNKFLELGIEDILKADLQKFKKCEYDIKAALRDLGCDVQFKEEWTGKGGLLTTQEKK